MSVCQHEELKGQILVLSTENKRLRKDRDYWKRLANNQEKKNNV